MHPSAAAIRTLFFDLDDTLYANASGLWQTIRERMAQYMHERLGLPADEVPRLRRSYFETYGTTLRGLQRHHHVDADDYLEYVHDLPLDRYLRPAPDLRQILLSLPQPRWIFTNADDRHARRVLSVLELDGCFSGIIDIRAVGFACKPEPVAFERALEIAGCLDPGECLLFDDSLSNLAGARAAGLRTAWVGANGSVHPEVDYSLPDLLALPAILPELWRSSTGVEKGG